MKDTAFEFWLLLALAGVACLAPLWPPLLAWWVIVALLWERRYGAACAWERGDGLLTIYVGEALICLPLIIVFALATLFSNTGANDE